MAIVQPVQTEPAKTTPPKRKRRWYQFSLRSLLLVVTVVGVWTPLLMKAAQAIHDAREAARHVRVYNTIYAPAGAIFTPPSRPTSATGK